MNGPRLDDLLRKLEMRLIRLETLVEEIRVELRGKNDVPQRDIHLEMLERNLLRLIKQWKATIRHAISAPELYADQKGSYYIQLEFVLGHARGLERGFDIDMSWSSSNKKFKSLIGDVSMNALAALFCVHGVPLSEIRGLVYNDETSARNSTDEGSLIPNLRE